MHATALVEVNIQIQTATFVLWLLGRFFLFSSYFAYLPTVFGFKTFGTINGLISLVASLVGLCQYPLTLSGKYTAINVAFVAMTITMYAFPAYLWHLETEEARRIETEASSNTGVELGDVGKAVAVTATAIV